MCVCEHGRGDAGFAPACSLDHSLLDALRAAGGGHRRGCRAHVVLCRRLLAGCRTAWRPDGTAAARQQHRRHGGAALVRGDGGHGQAGQRRHARARVCHAARQCRAARHQRCQRSRRRQQPSLSCWQGIACAARARVTFSRSASSGSSSGGDAAAEQQPAAAARCGWQGASAAAGPQCELCHAPHAPPGPAAAADAGAGRGSIAAPGVCVWATSLCLTVCMRKSRHSLPACVPLPPPRSHQAATWYCDHVCVVDVGTRETWLFPCCAWLGSASGAHAAGIITKVPVAPQRQLRPAASAEALRQLQQQAEQLEGQQQYKVDVFTSRRSPAQGGRCAAPAHMYTCECACVGWCTGRRTRAHSHTHRYGTLLAALAGRLAALLLSVTGSGPCQSAGPFAFGRPDSGPAAFAAGGCDSFQVTAGDLGKLQNIKVWCGAVCTRGWRHAHAVLALPVRVAHSSGTPHVPARALLAHPLHTTGGVQPGQRRQQLVAPGGRGYHSACQRPHHVVLR